MSITMLLIRPVPVDGYYYNVGERVQVSYEEALRLQDEAVGVWRP